MRLPPIVAYLILVVAIIGAFARTEDNRRDRLADGARTDVLICEENNRQDVVSTAILRASVKTRELDEARPTLTKKEKAVVLESYQQLVLQDCSNLPSVKRAAP